MDLHFRSPTPNKVLIAALVMALSLHGLLMFIELNNGLLEGNDLKGSLQVILVQGDSQLNHEHHRQEVTREPNSALEKLTEIETEIQPFPVVELQSIIATDASEGDQNSTKVVLFSHYHIGSWTRNNATEFVDEIEKTQLDGLRKGSYEHALLDPSRSDQRTSFASEAIATSDGVIHVHKIKGKDVCGIKVSAGEAFNDLDLAPIAGRLSGFACGDTKNRNILLSENDKIRNSDAQTWSISD